jgi:hypothetical protein
MSLGRFEEDGSRNAALQMHLVTQKRLFHEIILPLTAPIYK